MNLYPHVRTDKSVQENDYFDTLERTLNTGVSFGSIKVPNPVRPFLLQTANMAGVLFLLTSVAAGTQFALPHNLGYIPVGFLILNKTAPGDFYVSAPTTTTTMFITATSVNNNVVIMILG